MDYSSFLPANPPAPTPTPTPTPEETPTPTPTPAPTPLIVPTNPDLILNPLIPTVPVTIPQNRYYGFEYPSPVIYSVLPAEVPTGSEVESTNPYVILSNNL